MCPCSSWRDSLWRYGTDSSEYDGCGLRATSQPPKPQGARSRTNGHSPWRDLRRPKTSLGLPQFLELRAHGKAQPRSSRLRISVLPDTKARYADCSHDGNSIHASTLTLEMSQYPSCPRSASPVRRVPLCTSTGLAHAVANASTTQPVPSSRSRSPRRCEDRSHSATGATSGSGNSCPATTSDDRRGKKTADTTTPTTPCTGDPPPQTPTAQHAHHHTQLLLGTLRRSLRLRSSPCIEHKFLTVRERPQRAGDSSTDPTGRGSKRPPRAPTG